MNNSDTTARDVADLVAKRSDAAWKIWRASSPERRSIVIKRLADKLDEAQSSLADLAARETHLEQQRLLEEAHRSTVNARLMADTIVETLARATVVDPADSDRNLGPHATVERRPFPLGPVLNFTASNFPFSFSIFGGDTVAALAAGCSVICKAHPGHPQLSRATADLLRSELRALELPEDLIILVEGEDLGRELLTHKLVRAAAFTGSLRVGAQLFRMAANREDPIPFYGELGSVNPVFILPSAVKCARTLAEEIVNVTTWSCGQVCTKPGVIFVPEYAAIDAPLIQATEQVGPQLFLHSGIADSFSQRVSENAAVADLITVVKANLSSGKVAEQSITPGYARISLDGYLNSAAVLNQEVFGPYSLIVTYDPETELSKLPEVLETMRGNLTAAVHSDSSCSSEEEKAVVAVLSEELPYMVGRLIYNQWTSEMSITTAQHHGGPWPATTTDGIATTAIGPAGMLRFTRAVAFQNRADHKLEGSYAAQ